MALSSDSIVQGQVPTAQQWRDFYTDAYNQSVSTAASQAQPKLDVLTARVNGLASSSVQNPAIADQNMGNFRLRNIAAATLIDDAPRLDQVGWTRIGASVSANGQSVISFSTGGSLYSRVALEWDNLAVPATSGDGSIFCLFSTDNGSTYDTSQSYTYGFVAMTSGNSNAYFTGKNTAVYMNNGSGAAQVNEGKFEFSLINGKGRFWDLQSSGTNIILKDGWIDYSKFNITNVLIGCAATTFSSGTVRLLGWRA